MYVRFTPDNQTLHYKLIKHTGVILCILAQIIEIKVTHIAQLYDLICIHNQSPRLFLTFSSLHLHSSFAILELSFQYRILIAQI